jgi:uncharacterized protein YidB (DUF937 family)
VPFTHGSQENPAMNLIDQILSGAAGEAQTAANNPLASVQMLMGLIHRCPGGLQGLLQKLSERGLGPQVESWVNAGPNQPVSADQIIQALGSRRLQRVAEQFGVDQELLGNTVADLLPDLVDRLTPAGRADEAMIESGLARLKGVIRGL